MSRQSGNDCVFYKEIHLCLFSQSDSHFRPEQTELPGPVLFVFVEGITSLSHSRSYFVVGFFSYHGGHRELRSQVAFVFQSLLILS